jgi:hypothetical protein
MYLLGPGPRLMKKRIYRAAVSQRLRNTDLHYDARIQEHHGLILFISVYILPLVWL